MRAVPHTNDRGAVVTLPRKRLELSCVATTRDYPKTRERDAVYRWLVLCFVELFSFCVQNKNKNGITSKLHPAF